MALAARILAKAISLADRINALTEPFEPFNRPPVPYDELPLEKKEKVFREEIEKDFLRDDGKLFWSVIPNDLGDMAIWHGYWTAYLAMRWRATGAAQDRAWLAKALNGQWLLQTVSKAPLVRGVDPKGGDARRDHAYYREGSAGYDYVEDASGSSLSGHVYGLAHAMDAGREMKDQEMMKYCFTQLSELVSRLEADGFYLTNSDGSKTRFGDFAVVCGVANPVHLTTLAALLVNAARTDLLQKIFGDRDILNLLTNPEIHLLWKDKHYDEHTTFMDLDAVLLGRPPLEISCAAFTGLHSLWNKTKEKQNSFFHFIYARHHELPVKYLAQAVTGLREFRAPKIVQDVNLTNLGYQWLRVVTWGGRATSTQPMPMWMRPQEDVMWQRSPYFLTGWGPGAKPRFSGLDFLIAYQMGKTWKLF